MYIFIDCFFFISKTGQDGHKSEYDLTYLTNQAYELELRKKHSLKRVYWDKDILTNKLHGLEKVDFQSYINDKASVKKSFEAIVKHGAVLIENVRSNKKADLF